MYCSTCELEIKGDDKDTCPVCGGPLAGSHVDDSTAVEQSQKDPSGAEKPIKASGDPAEREPLPDEPGADEVFVLKDYASDELKEDSTAVQSGARDEPALSEQSGVQNSDEPPLLREPAQGSTDHMDDILDSIRESLATSVSPDAGPAGVGGELDSLEVDFGSFDSFDQDASSDAAIENTADKREDISWGYDEAASAVPMTEAPQRKRSPVFGIILVVVLIAVGGYYVLITRSGDQEPFVNNTVGAPVVAEPVIEEKSESAERTADAKPDETVIPAEDENVAFVKPDSAGKTRVVEPPLNESEVRGERGLSEAFVSKEPVVARGAAEVKLSAGAESDAAILPGQAETDDVYAEAVIAGEGEAVNPSVGAEPVAPVEPEKAEDVVPVTPAPVKAPFFTVHVGSYKKRNSASSEVARIEAKGYDAFIERVDLGRKGVWYRVKVGRFKNRADAEQLQKKIKKVLVTDSMVVTQRTN